MSHHETDLTLSLEALTGLVEGDPDDAPTEMIADFIRAWKTPLNELSDVQTAELVIQQAGFPYLLDLIWPKLKANPLFDSGYYPGDLLSNLIRAKPIIWAGRPTYESELENLYRRALSHPVDESRSFRESLKLQDNSSLH